MSHYSRLRNTETIWPVGEVLTDHSVKGYQHQIGTVKGGCMFARCRIVYPCRNTAEPC